MPRYPTDTTFFNPDDFVEDEPMDVQDAWWLLYGLLSSMKMTGNEKHALEVVNAHFEDIA